MTRTMPASSTSVRAVAAAAPRRCAGRLLGVATSALLAAALSPTLTEAADFTVTTNNDFGTGSLREAINAANASSGPDTITFLVTGVIVLTAPLPEITDTLALQGPGVDVLSLSGNDSVRVLSIAQGAALSIADLAIVDGFAGGSDDFGRGGGLFNAGDLDLFNVVMRGNFASDGGAIHNGPGAGLAVFDSLLENNGAQSNGGAIHNHHGVVSLLDSELRFNSAVTGGAIANVRRSPAPGITGVVQVQRSSLIGNAAGSEGGALYIDGQRATVVNSTLSGNHVAGGAGSTGGGAIATRTAGTELRLVNSTLSGNYVAGFDSLGAGAIDNINNAAAIVLVHVTVVDNDAPETAGIKGTFSSRSSLFANNGNNCAGFIGVPVDLGGNLSSDGTCAGFTQVVPASLALGALTDNGGGTATHALGQGSVAIDNVAVCTDETGATVARDQRGVDRPVDGTGNGIAFCDTGAFEANDRLFADGFE